MLRTNQVEVSVIRYSKYFEASSFDVQATESDTAVLALGVP
jgi:hypothetical protein